MANSEVARKRKSNTKTPLMTDGAGVRANSCQYSMKEREKLFN